MKKKSEKQNELNSIFFLFILISRFACLNLSCRCKINSRVLRKEFDLAFGGKEEEKREIVAKSWLDGTWEPRFLPVAKSRGFNGAN